MGAGYICEELAGLYIFSVIVVFFSNCSRAIAPTGTPGSILAVMCYGNSQSKMQGLAVLCDAQSSKRRMPAPASNISCRSQWRLCWWPKARPWLRAGEALGLVRSWLLIVNYKDIYTYTTMKTRRKLKRELVVRIPCL